MKTNFHTHHELCGHAGGHVEDYVKEAIKAHYSILGISDHGPLPDAPFKRMDINDFNNIYLKEIEEAKIKYGNKIKIYAGLEIEYITKNYEYYKSLKQQVDYLILGTHFYSCKEGYQDKSSYAVGTKENLLEYTELIIEALNTKLFRILAHPDLFLIGYPIFDSFAEECSKKIIDAAIRNDVLIEFNANGLRRGKKAFQNETTYAYPNKHFFELVKEREAKVIVSSDCHDPSLLDDKYMKKARKLAGKLKLNIVYKI